MTETEHERLARITGVPVGVVASALSEPLPGQLRPAEIEDARRRVDQGEAAALEIAFRAMVRDIDPALVWESCSSGFAYTSVRDRSIPSQSQTYTTPRRPP